MFYVSQLIALIKTIQTSVTQSEVRLGVQVDVCPDDRIVYVALLSLLLAAHVMTNWREF